MDFILFLSAVLSIVGLISLCCLFMYPKYNEIFYEEFGLKQTFGDHVKVTIIHILLILCWINILILLILFVSAVVWYLSSALYFIRTGESLKEPIKNYFEKLKNKLNSGEKK